MSLLKITAGEAYENTRTNAQNGWPKRGDAGNRVEPLTKPHFAPSFTLTPKESVFTIGSCFARNVESSLERLGFDVPMVERWRLRGLGGAVLTREVDDSLSPIVGRGTRLGGTLRLMGGGIDTDLDAFETHAHRFFVLVPRHLSDEQRDVARLILETHKPAHTTYSLCETGTMHVGSRLHVGLTAVVGPCPEDRWLLGTATAEQTVLGRRSVVGASVRAGEQLGSTSAVGSIRVG